MADTGLVWSARMMKVHYALSGGWFDGSRPSGGLKSGSGVPPPVRV